MKDILNKFDYNGYYFDNYEGPYYRLHRSDGSYVKGVVFREFLEHNTIEIVWCQNGSIEVGPIHFNRESVLETIEWMEKLS